MTRYLLAGGGTAGHVNPLLATADALRDAEPDADVLVLGTREGLESRLVPERGYELLIVPRLPFPRRPDAAALRFPGRLRASIDTTAGYLRDRGIDAVVGFGGYAAAPAYLAARRFGVPIAVHEQNAKPGIANRLGARFTRHVGVTFPSTRLPHATLVGMPLRREIVGLDRAARRGEAAATFDLDATRPTLLVTGGSLGARRINDTVSRSVALLLGAGWQVLHITGDRSELRDPGLPGYRMMRYCDRMDLALALADLAVCRAGAGTVSELSAVGVPAVYVPYPVGNGEQRHNARDAVAAGGARLVDDAAFTPDWVRDELVPLLADRASVARMAAHALETGVRDGAERMVALVRDALERKVP
ncbi:UDP-N-acetylglucosamine--N-acetylmuramyl-(pentapeptide) pyrophosphoryl-undecaprenol N-acetylglucosamine transferase [Diaminobutyricimonas aerilata]|uniref:UDP-N-acetylglucosamine--N-acetylmuramyl-(pentapeptide) pyrophosphoryl-undecaprenol N-acetylglucosamine transferase n=1 Tax=Diaminobutyricimonas aerilata TaxID=1162967 RepID=A0A2M9CKH6_9MICO|nr:UDP-N-acetylglucosamine--N-acetylmuramyl-(pentapeptide) pyrophosphoryl-undecaprenol N-acetylglucosamine transferase [Diaminobutyricimonas aerilata]PJJ72386.1 UDP-N-acetylglucosamine--N-acetylmuramyl-(pentapeptide) pyrophosphoryl-undecaprenol N-acetylglucosamine transferase [Diaminobutyricimonas aerilata]